MNQLLTEVSGLVGDLQNRAFDEDEVFLELNTNAVKSVPGAQSAGITVVRDGTIETLGATDGDVTAFDDLQRKHQQGPCLEAAWQNHIIRVDDLRGEQRWPRFRAEALATTPIRSIAAFRLFDSGKVTGALNFYAPGARAFDDQSIELGLVFATHTALAWDIIRRNEQFESALASRDVIGQAKGIVMERFNMDAVRAFELLKQLSQNSNTPLSEIARRLILSDHPHE
jgi:GAF domain-containing protein